MASLGSPLRTFRGLLRELRYALGGIDVSYRNKAAYRYLKEAFRCHRTSLKNLFKVKPESPVASSKSTFGTTMTWLTENLHRHEIIMQSTWGRYIYKITSEKLCKAQHDLHFQAATYLCLLHSIREHLVLHKEYHGKGERSPDIVAGLVGFKLPQQPGGKGWEP